MEIKTVCPMCGSPIVAAVQQSTTISYCECPVCHSICNAQIAVDYNKEKPKTTKEVPTDNGKRTI